MHTLLGVVDAFRRADPRLVVEIGRHGLWRIVGSGGIDRKAYLNMFEIADATASDVISGFTELLVGSHRPLLTADLKDSAGLRDRVAKEYAFGVRHRHRLL